MICIGVFVLVRRYKEKARLQMQQEENLASIEIVIPARGSVQRRRSSFFASSSSSDDETNKIANPYSDQWGETRMDEWAELTRKKWRKKSIEPIHSADKVPQLPQVYDVEILAPDDDVEFVDIDAADAGMARTDTWNFTSFTKNAAVGNSAGSPKKTSHSRFPLKIKFAIGSRTPNSGSSGCGQRQRCPIRCNGSG